MFPRKPLLETLDLHFAICRIEVCISDVWKDVLQRNTGSRLSPSSKGLVMDGRGGVLVPPCDDAIQTTLLGKRCSPSNLEHDAAKAAAKDRGHEVGDGVELGLGVDAGGVLDWDDLPRGVVGRIDAEGGRAEACKQCH